MVFWILFFQNYRKYSRRYKEFLENNGISLSICQVRWYTTRYNRSFVRFGQIHPYLLHVWFSVGVLVGVLLMVASVVILCLTLYKAFAKDAPEQVLTPVVSSFCLFLKRILVKIFHDLCIIHWMFSHKKFEKCPALSRQFQRISLPTPRRASGISRGVVVVVGEAGFKPKCGRGMDIFWIQPAHWTQLWKWKILQF